MTESTMSRPDTSDLAAVHGVFRSALAQAPALVASAAGNDGRRAMVANFYANLMSFLEVHHDGEEQLVFPPLLERAPGRRAVVEASAAQHAVVVTHMAAVNDSIQAWEKGGDPEAGAVVAALGALADVLIPHLDEEEAEIAPLAAEHLTVEEWGSLPGHAMGHFQGDKIWLIMGLVRENFTQEQRDRMLENMPPPARAMWETTGEVSFNELVTELRTGS